MEVGFKSGVVLPVAEVFFKVTMKQVTCFGGEPVLEGIHGKRWGGRGRYIHFIGDMASFDWWGFEWWLSGGTSPEDGYTPRSKSRTAVGTAHVGKPLQLVEG